MTDPLSNLSKAERSRLKPAADTSWMPPMLATLSHNHFSSEAWIYERKLDGVRALAFCSGNCVSLMSRNRHSLDRTYPELIEGLSRSPGRYAVDGEIVTFDGKVTSFGRLQARMQVKNPASDLVARVPVYFYVFDMLRYGDWDLTALPLRRRKAILKQALVFRDPIRFCPHINTDGETFLAEACRKGWEGLIAKRAASGYVGQRSRDWLKFKCENRQELVIAGYTEPNGGRIGFGALLLGYHQDGRLHYAGKVGTGFDDRFLESFGERLRRAEIDRPAFVDPPTATRGVHWTRPEFVGEVAFTEWTGDGKLRHPRFEGLRDDKAPREVVRETDPAMSTRGRQ